MGLTREWGSTELWAAYSRLSNHRWVTGNSECDKLPSFARQSNFRISFDWCTLQRAVNYGAYANQWEEVLDRHRIYPFTASGDVRWCDLATTLYGTCHSSPDITSGRKGLSAALLSSSLSLCEVAYSSDSSLAPTTTPSSDVAVVARFQTTSPLQQEGSRALTSAFWVLQRQTLLAMVF